MDIKKYQKIVDKYKPKENKSNNLLIAFLTGGSLGMLANLIINLYAYLFHISTKEAGGHMLVTFIFITCLLTGIGVFDDLVKKGKMGLIIPITGFAHSMTSAAIEYRNEGLVLGIGANIFKLAGTVILYGTVAVYIFGLIRLFIGG